jgi:acyl-CoA synthetase (AMP-forming)/AMP-acid ligase II
MTTSPVTNATAAEPPPFRDMPSMVAEHARSAPDAIAVRCGEQAVNYGQLDARMDRVAAALQRDGLQPTSVVAICAASSIDYIAVFCGALRAGVAVAPLAPSSTAAQLADMLADSGARLFFTDAATLATLHEGGIDLARLPRVLRLDEGIEPWLPPAGTRPTPVTIDPAWPFNLIYSSGTTGTPKGIVQPHAMRWMHIQRAPVIGYGPDCVTLIATPLYSNTTLVAVIPTLAMGGQVILMAKFDALHYLELAQKYRATHTMLVPVQYQRLMARPEFGNYDLSSYRVKLCTSAPFHADLKADILARWPGALIEYYGMTEGGGTCILHAHLHPTKLHTVGQPAEGHDIRLIDEQGREVPPGEPGEVVGRSGGMMSGYHNQPAKTAEAEWYSPDGLRFIRTGDVGRFDADRFLTLFDRRKDMIISGGFNIYPSDLEAVLRQHPDVADAAVIGVPSAEWGETPVACVVLRPGAEADGEAVRQWVNAQVGKTQRLSALRVMDELPRSAIGKILKRELRDAWKA